MIEAAKTFVGDAPGVAFIVAMLVVLLVGLVLVDLANRVLDRIADLREQRERTEAAQRGSGYALGANVPKPWPDGAARGYEAAARVALGYDPEPEPQIDWAHLSKAREASKPLHAGNAARGKLLRH